MIIYLTDYHVMKFTSQHYFPSAMSLPIVFSKNQTVAGTVATHVPSHMFHCLSYNDESTPEPSRKNNPQFRQDSSGKRWATSNRQLREQDLP